MALTDPRTFFGIHQMTAINRTTYIPYGTIRVLASAESTREREQIDLFGGSNPNLWDTEDGNVTGDITLNIKEFAPFLYTLAGYSTTSVTTPSATGTVGTVTNKVGTSIATDFSVAVTGGDSADLKSGRYIVEGTATADQINLYAVLSTDFSTGTDASYSDDTLLIATGALSTINTALAAYGLTASGTWTFTDGDVAYFDVYAPYTAYHTQLYGENPNPIEFEMWLSSQKKSNGEFVQHHFPRVKMSSMPASLNEKAWSEGSITIKTLYDSTAGYSHRMIDIVK